MPSDDVIQRIGKYFNIESIVVEDGMSMTIEKDLEWTSHDGKQVQIKDMDEHYAKNILRKIVRRLEADDKEASFHKWLNKED